MCSDCVAPHAKSQDLLLWFVATGLQLSMEAFPRGQSIPQVWLSFLVLGRNVKRNDSGEEVKDVQGIVGLILYVIKSIKSYRKFHLFLATHYNLRPYLAAS